MFEHSLQARKKKKKNRRGNSGCICDLSLCKISLQEETPIGVYAIACLQAQLMVVHIVKHQSILVHLVHACLCASRDLHSCVYLSES